MVDSAQPGTTIRNRSLEPATNNQLLVQWIVDIMKMEIVKGRIGKKYSERRKEKRKCKIRR